MRVPIALCAALVAAGCGGGDGVTRAEWARDADAICAEYRRRLDALGTADALPQLARLLDRGVALLEEARGKLRRLEPPPDDEARIRRMLEYMEQATRSARGAATAARRGDEQAVAVAIGESDSASSQAQHIARDLGARACAQP